MSLVNKEFIKLMVSEEVFLQDSQQVVPSVQDDTILPVWVGNHRTGFG